MRNVRKYNKKFLDEILPEQEKQDVVVRLGKPITSYDPLTSQNTITYPTEQTIKAYVAQKELKGVVDNTITIQRITEVQISEEIKGIKEVEIEGVKYSIESDKVGQGYTVLKVIRK